MKPIGWALLLAMIGLAFPANALTQQEAVQDASSAAFVAWAREHAQPLLPCTAQSDSGAMRGVDVIVGDARVVALGEPTHGAHEPLAFRNCLFRYLVEHHGFTAIAIESGLNEAQRLHNYVAGGPGDARQLVRDSLTWGFGRFTENVELIEWIHRYNADPAHRRKIRFYGIDMSGGDGSGAWRSARITLQDSLAYLARVTPTQSRRAREAVEPFLDHFTLPGYAALPHASQARLRSAIDGLVRFFDRERAHLVGASAPADYDWARRNAILARQLGALFRVSRPAASGEDLSPDDYKADAARDAAMAANVRWVIEREGPKGRILLFAHNGHVMNARTRGGIWSVYAQAPAAMGKHLRTALGKRLLIMPISGASGGPALSANTPEFGSLDSVLSKAGHGHFLLDLRIARKDAPASVWLAQTQTLRANFNTENLIAPASAFDAIVFFYRLTPAVQSGATAAMPILAERTEISPDRLLVSARSWSAAR